MKTITCLLSLVLATSAFGADSSKILLRGTTAIAEEWKVTGAARAIVGDINVSADTITYDRGKNLLRCEGAVTIRVLDHVMTSKDCVLQLSAGEKKVFILGEGAMTIMPDGESASQSSTPVRRVEGRNDRVKLHFEYSMRPDSSPASTVAPEPTRGR